MGIKAPNPLNPLKKMVSSEEFTGLLRPLLHYLKKMELELTCPSCSELLSYPTLLPCNHMFCSNCVKTGDDRLLNCLACPSSFSFGDLRHPIQVDAIIDIFRSMDDAITAIVRKLDFQVDIPGMKASSKDTHILGDTSSEGKLQGVQVDISSMKPSNVSPVFKSNRSEVPLKDSKFDMSGLQLPSKDIPLSDHDVASKDLQGSRCGISDKQVSGSLSMDDSQKKTIGTATEGEKGVVLRPCADPCERKFSENSKKASSCRSSSQLDADNAKTSKRQKPTCAHDSKPENQLLRTSWKLPRLVTKEPTSTSSCLGDHSFLVEDSILGQQFHDHWVASFGASCEWSLCVSDLSPFEEKLLDKFASLTGISISRKWKKDATHVIVSTDEHGECNSTKNVLMAVLSGRWILKIDWVKACIEARQPIPEEPYEISQVKLVVLTGAHGPKKGRQRVMAKAPKIFCGSSFYLCNQFNKFERNYFEELIIAAGGIVLKEDNLKSKCLAGKPISLESSYIVYYQDLPQTQGARHLEGSIGMKRFEEAGPLAARTGFMLIGHLCLLDTIATCSSADSLASGDGNQVWKTYQRRK